MQLPKLGSRVPRSTPLATADLPGHPKHTTLELPPLHRAQHALIVLINATFKLYRFTTALPNAVSRAARTCLILELAFNGGGEPSALNGTFFSHLKPLDPPGLSKHAAKCGYGAHGKVGFKKKPVEAQ